MISYAQNLEDVLINRFFADEPIQKYVDVGAGHHSYHSTTKHFYDAGWSGLNIEPRFQLWQLLCRERPRDMSRHCAVSDQPGEATFYQVTSPTFTGTDAGGLSTLDAKQAEGYDKMGFIVEEMPIRIFTLSELFVKHNIKDIGFLKIDVEGLEYSVIKGLDLQRWRPRMILTESTLPMTSKVCDEPLQAYLKTLNYHSAFFDGLNRYFIRDEDHAMLDRLSTPANVTDGYQLAEVEELRLQLAQKTQEVKQLQMQLANYRASA